MMSLLSKRLAHIVLFPGQRNQLPLGNHDIPCEHSWRLNDVGVGGADAHTVKNLDITFDSPKT